MNVLFPPLHLGAALQLAVRLPGLLLTQTWTVLRGLVRYFVECSSVWVVSSVSHDGTGVLGVKYLSHHIVSGLHVISMTYTGPDHLVAMVSARFPHCKVTISLFPHLRSKSLSPAYPPFVEGFKLSSIPWQFHLFSPICSFYLSHLFISINSCIHIFYFRW